MRNGRRRRRRRKNARRRAALAAKIDAIPDELFELVFLRLHLPLHLVRAACTCKRWRRIIAADGGRVIRCLYGAPSSHVVGHYYVDERWHGSRPPGRNPFFVPSSSSPWADILAARNLALDFLPQPEFSCLCWELADIRGGLLLLLLFGKMSDWSLASPLRLLVCDPLARSYREISLPAWFRGCACFGAFLRDGEDTGARISLSNFRVTCATYCPCVASACTFSSATGSRWTSGAAVRGNDLAKGSDIRFAGCGDDGSVAYWTIGGVPALLSLDKETAELSSSFVPNDLEYDMLRRKRHEPVYTYQLPWPPTIRACLS